MEIRTRGFLAATGLATLIGLLLVSLGEAAEPAPKYYMVIFAEQARGWNSPWKAHTFATFVKVVGSPGDGPKLRLETHTISWLPATDNIRIFAESEPGHNFGLRYSLDRSIRFDLRLTRWGPYRIRKELYDRALAKIKKLKSGGPGWKALDRDQRRAGTACNCFHAISDLDTERGLLETRRARGELASQLVARHLRRWMIEPEKTHEWLTKHLGLDRYPIATGSL